VRFRCAPLHCADIAREFALERRRQDPVYSPPEQRKRAAALLRCSILGSLRTLVLGKNEEKSLARVTRSGWTC
jgi:hypothetical protein